MLIGTIQTYNIESLDISHIYVNTANWHMTNLEHQINLSASLRHR